MNNVKMGTVSKSKIVIIAVFIIASVIIISDEIQYRFGIGDYSNDTGIAGENLYFFDNSECNVALIKLHGDLYTYYDASLQSVDDISSSEDILILLKTAESLPNIKAIILEIDSYGGFPVASKEIADTLNFFLEKPVIGHIRGGGLSAAYWVASATDIIFASELSDIGSIGVTQSYLDESILNQREGYTYNKLNTGKFKDILDPEKPLTSEERKLLQRDLDITHDIFIKDVAQNRGIEIEEVRKLADGSSMMGAMALEAGLIDRIGGIYEVKDYIFDELGIDPIVCN